MLRRLLQFFDRDIWAPHPSAPGLEYCILTGVVRRKH